MRGMGKASGAPGFIGGVGVIGGSGAVVTGTGLRHRRPLRLTYPGRAGLFRLVARTAGLT